MDRREYEARVVDDGTLDTVIRVRNCVTRRIHEFRYDSELFTKHSSSGLVVIRDIDKYIEVAIGDMMEMESIAECITMEG